MRITLRFYRIHDADLITLLNAENFSLNRVIYLTLKGYANKKPYWFIPPRRNEIATEENTRYSYRMNLILDEERDRKIIDLLSIIKPRYRNVFIKNLVRASMIGQCAYLCYEDDVFIEEDTSDYITSLANFLGVKNVKPEELTDNDDDNTKKRKRKKSTSESKNIISEKTNKTIKKENVEIKEIDIPIKKDIIKDVKEDDKKVSTETPDFNLNDDDEDEFDAFSSLQNMLSNF